MSEGLQLKSSYKGNDPDLGEHEALTGSEGAQPDSLSAKEAGRMRCRLLRGKGTLMALGDSP